MTLTPYQSSLWTDAYNRWLAYWLTGGMDLPAAKDMARVQANQLFGLDAKAQAEHQADVNDERDGVTR